MPTDPTRDAIRRVIADSEPMWRDTAVDRLTDDIVAALPTPQPATGDDAMERAARGLLDLLDEMNTAGHIAYADYSRLHDEVSAALAAARAGEAEVPCFCSPADGDYGHPECKAHQSAQRGEEAVDPDDPRRLYDLTPEQSEAAWRVGSGVRRDEHPTVDHDFTRGGEAVDREALREAMLSRWWMDQTGPDADHWETLDAEERENVAENSYVDTFLNAVLDYLAARGDAAPTISAEQHGGAPRHGVPIASRFRP